MKIDEHQYQDFYKMLRQCGDILLNVCVCFTERGREDYRDMYQEIACTLWEAWPKFRAGSNIRAWVTRTALNVAGHEVRKRKRRPQFVEFDESFYDTLAMEATDTRYQLLYDLLDKIDANDRKILFLYIDCRQMKEIAEITGLSEQAVKQRIYRIKKKLNALKNEE